MQTKQINVWKFRVPWEIFDPSRHLRIFIPLFARILFQDGSKSPEGHCSADQLDLPMPAEPFACPNLALRVSEPPD